MAKFVEGSIQHLVNVAHNGIYFSENANEFLVKDGPDVYVVDDPGLYLDSYADHHKAAEAIIKDKYDIIPADEVYGSIDNFIEVEQEFDDWTFVCKY